MAKFYGAVGFVSYSDPSKGVFEENPIEKNYYGDITKNGRKWVSSENLNDDMDISNTISILADSFAYENIGAMRYVKYMGAPWKITSVEIQRPRIILYLGGLYNGETAETS